jgi:ABC-type polar amino acid transport system ATPase subunit
LISHQLAELLNLHNLKTIQTFIENPTNYEPLRMIVSGTAGSGKSYLIKCLVPFRHLPLTNLDSYQKLKKNSYDQSKKYYHFLFQKLSSNLENEELTWYDNNFKYDDGGPEYDWV